MTPVVPGHDESLHQAWQSFPPDVGSTHGAQLCAFVADRDRGRRPLTSGFEARKTLEFLTAIYKSAFTGETIARGSIRPDDPFYRAIHGGRSLERRKASA